MVKHIIDIYYDNDVEPAAAQAAASPTNAILGFFELSCSLRIVRKALSYLGE